MSKEFSLGCLVVGSCLIRKKEKLAEMVTRCHSLDYFLSLVIYCHSLYHSLSFNVTRCHSLYHWLSLAVTRCTTRLSFYKRSAKRANVDHYSISLINFSLIIHDVTSILFIFHFNRLLPKSSIPRKELKV